MFRNLSKMFVACALIGMCAGSVFARVPGNFEEDITKTWFDECPSTSTTNSCEQCCRRHTKTELGYANCKSGSDCEGKGF